MKHTPPLKPLLLAALFAWSCKSRESILPERRDITQAVYASGKILPLNHYLVTAKTPGYVKSILVKSGDLVRTGDPLLTLSNDANELAINSATNTAELARRNADENGPALSAAREELRSSRARYELDSINFSRNNALLKEDAVSKAAFDQSKTQLDLSRSAFMRSQANYQLTVERTRTEYLNAMNQSRSQRSNRDDYVLAAAIDGKVYDVLPKPGDLVTAQLPIVELGAADSFEVELSIDETDIGLVKRGQEVIFGIDAYPDRMFKGVITEIIPKVAANSKSSRVKASIITDAAAPLFSGMSAEGNIIVAIKKNCLVVPRDYVKNGNELKVQGEDAPRKIRKGLEDLQYVEVVDGLSGNESLIK